jgi:hypothetical protein
MADYRERLIDERGWGVWAAEIKAIGECIGCVGLHIPQDNLPVSPCVEILWRLAQAIGVKSSPPKPHEAHCTLASRHWGYQKLYRLPCPLTPDRAPSWSIFACKWMDFGPI